MHLKRKGYPEDQELVICTVTSVQYHSVFAKLDEFPGKSGMIHISEIAPGRIRNIREYVTEGKKVICKILKVDKERDRIDLSLRRVNERERRSKNDQIRREQQAEKILEYFSGQQKKEFKDVYGQIHAALMDTSKEEHFIYLADIFDDVVNKDLDLTASGFAKSLAEPLMELIKQRIKPPEVTIEGDVGLTSYRVTGLQDIQTVLKGMKQPKKGVTVAYTGGGHYTIRVVAPDYRAAEKVMKTTVEAAEKKAKKIARRVSI